MFPVDKYPSVRKLWSLLIIIIELEGAEVLAWLYVRAAGVITVVI